MNVVVAPLADQGLPSRGRHLLASYDEESVVVWQAHNNDVADAALTAGRFGGPAWRTDRLTRLRLSALSMLARCRWGTRRGRERILAVTLQREALDTLLRQAVHWRFEPEIYPSQASWRLATRYSNVSVAWYPDVDTHGVELERQTPRLGLRDAALRNWTENWVLGVEDWTGWVHQHRADRTEDLPVPLLRPYPLPDAVRNQLIGRR